MSFSFPTSPTLNQEYTFGNKTWRYNGTGWVLVTGVDAAQSAWSTANLAYIQANTATNIGQGAYDNSNTKFDKAGGTISGNVTVQYDLSVLGNVNFVGNVTSITVTGNSGQFFGYASNGHNALYAGIPTGYDYQPFTVFQASANYDGYSQINIQNINTGPNASGDYVATADNGTEDDTYIDMGIGSSAHFDPEFTLIGPNDGYLYAHGNTTTSGGDLVIGTFLPQNDVVLAAGGMNNENEQMRIIGSSNTITVRANLDTSNSKSVSLGIIANVHITGGSNDDYIRTDGAGNLTFAPLTSANVIKVLYNTANASFIHSNSGFIQANAAFDHANAAFIAANSAAGTYANAAFVHANAAYESQNATGQYANAAFIQANTGYNLANSIANNSTVAGTSNVAKYAEVTTKSAATNYYVGLVDAVTGNLVIGANSALYFNSGLRTLVAPVGQFATSVTTTSLLPAATIITVFNTTATTIRMGGAATTINIGNAGGITNVFGTLAVNGVSVIGFTQGAYDTGNSAFIQANASFNHANAAFAAANNVTPQVQPAFDTANAAFIQANASFAKANNALANTSGTTFNGEFLIGSGGKLTVLPIGGEEGGEILLGKPPSGNLDGGITIDAYQDKLRIFEQGGSARGVFIDLTQAAAGVATNLLTGGTGDINARNTANAAFIQANASFSKANNADANALSAGVYANSAYAHANAAFNSANNVAPQVQPAFNTANAAFIQANSAFASVNTVAIFANTPSYTANSAAIYANGAFAQANVANNNANSASVYANSSFVVANSGFIQANSAFFHANAAFNTGNASFVAANSGGIYANGAFATANSGSQYANSAFVVANSGFIQANSAFAHANAAFNSANNVAPQVQPAFNTANAAFIQANSSFIHANAAFNAANNASDPWVRGQANAAFNQANAAFAKANTGANAEVSTFTTTANGSVSTFALGFTPASNSAVIVSIGGVVQLEFDDYEVNRTNNSISFNEPPPAGEKIRVAGFNNVTPYFLDVANSAGAVIASYNGIGDGSTQGFNIGFRPESGNTIFVSIGGILQPEDAFTVNPATNTVTFLTAPGVGENIRVVGYQKINPYYIQYVSSNVSVSTFETTANGNFSTFNLGFLPQAREVLIVSVDGVIQPITSYTVNNIQQTITFDGAPANGELVRVITMYTTANAFVTPDGSISLVKLDSQLYNLIYNSSNVANNISNTANIAIANVQSASINTIANLESASANTISNTSVLNTANAAFRQANAAFITANSGFIQANAAFTAANSAASTGKAIAMALVFGG